MAMRGYEHFVLSGISLAGEALFTTDLLPLSEDGIGVQMICEKTAEILREDVSAVSLLQDGQVLPLSGKLL